MEEGAVDTVCITLWGVGGRKGAEPVRDPVMAKVTHGCVVRRQWAGEAGHRGRGLLQGAMRSRGLLSGGLEEQL